MRRTTIKRLAPRFLFLAFWFVGAQSLFGQVNITTTSPLPGGVVGTPYSLTFAATGGIPATYSWSRVSGTLPAGLSLSTAGVLSGTPTSQGGSNFRIRVTSTIVSLTVSDEMNFTLEVNNALAIMTASLPSGLQGTSYNQSLSASGGKNPQSWTVVSGSGSLPGGLNLANDGKISGNPNAPGIFNFTVRVTDSSSPAQTSTKALSITIVAPLSITTASPLPAGVLGTAYSRNLAATGGVTPYTWTLISGSTPTGISLSGAGVLSGTPLATGNSNFTVRVSDSSSPALTAQKALVLSVVTPLTITTSSPLTSGLVSVAYSQTLSASGGTAPLTWSIASGALPDGFALSTGGVLSGTPSATGTASFTVKVADSTNPALEVQKDFTLDIALPLIISTASPLPIGITGAAYSQNMSAAGGIAPYSWSVISGSLPAGLSLSGAGLLSGNPTATSSATFTIRVLDSSTPPQNFQKNFTLNISGPLSITTTSPLSSAFTGTAYSQTLVAAGGTAPLIWSVASGSLPAGLSLSSGGIISGTPTTPGASNFTVKVDDSNTPQQTSQKALSIVVSTPLIIMSTSPLPDAAVGVSYSQNLTATGATPPYTWVIAAGTLPDGLSLSSSGLIQGISTQAGTFNFTVRVTDSSSQGVTTTAVFQLRVKNFLTITTASVPAAAIGSSYSVQLEAAGDPPLSWSLFSGALPAGITLSAAGVIGGTPSATGTFDFTVRVATDSPAQEFKRNYQIIVSAALAVSSATLPAGTRFTPYTTTLSASGGVAPYGWTIASGTLPAGLSLSASGVISGTSSLAGTFNFTVRVMDAGNASATRPLTLTMIDGALHITTTSLSAGIQGFAFSQQLEASGGPTPFIWSLAGGTLPTGFTLSAAGLLQGTSSAAITSTIGARVTDASGTSDVRSLIIVIGPPLGAISLTGIPQNLAPAQQTPIAVAIPAAYAADLQGTLNLAYNSTAVVPINDPAVQFSTGGRSVKFTIPANTTTAVFPSPLMLIDGTVAGTVAISGSIQNGPSNMALLSTTVDATAPQIMSVAAIRITGGLSVKVVGFSPERRVTETGFSIEIRVNGAIQTVNLTKPADSDFGAWYQNPQSSPFGSAFRFEQLFAVSGDTSVVEAVTVTLKNAQGSTVSARVPFTAN